MMLNYYIIFLIKELYFYYLYLNQNKKKKII